MLRLMLVVFASASTILASAVSGNDLEKLQGRWRLTHAEDSHGLAKDQGFVKYTLVIQDAKMSREFDGGRNDTPRPFSIVPTGNPKRIDFTTGGKPAHDRVGIYSIEENKLKICFSTIIPPKELHRPSDFTTPDGSGRVFLMFTRVQGEEQQDSPTVRDLLKQRRDTLETLVSVVKQQANEGIVQYDAVLHASNQLLEAELELALTRQQRIKILERRVKNFEELEKIVAIRWQNSAGATHDKFLTAKAARLEAQIMLQRERESDR